MNKSNKLSPEVQKRAVRTVQEPLGAIAVGANRFE